MRDAVFNWQLMDMVCKLQMYVETDDKILSGCEHLLTKLDFALELER